MYQFTPLSIEATMSVFHLLQKTIQYTESTDFKEKT